MLKWLIGGVELCCVKANTDEEVCVSGELDLVDPHALSKKAAMRGRSHYDEPIVGDPSTDEAIASQQAQVESSFGPAQGWQVRRKAAENLGKLGAFAIEDVTPRLMEALHDEHWQVRRAAANSLRELGQPAVEQAQRALCEACGDRDNLVAAAAAKALAAHGLPLPSPPTVISPERAPATEGASEQPSYCTAETTEDEEEGIADDKHDIMKMEMKTEMTDGGSTTASVKTSGQPTEFGIVLGCKEGHRGRLGIDIDFGHPRYLKILKVYSGLIQDWNLAHPEMQVEAGDYFVEINGWTNNARKLMEVLTLANELQVVVRKAESTSSQNHAQV